LDIYDAINLLNLLFKDHILEDQLTHILPQLASCALSTNASTDIDNLCRFIKNTVTELSGLTFALQKPFGQRLEGPVEDSHSVSAPGQHPADRLLRQLASGREECYPWNGDALLRLEAIIRLHRILYKSNRDTFHRPTFSCVLHWRLVFDSHGPEFADEFVQTLDEFITQIIGRYTTDAFPFCCTFITSGSISSLPRSVVLILRDAMEKVERRDTIQVQNHIQSLFEHFLDQDPLKPVDDTSFLTTREDLWRTVSAIVESAIERLRLPQAERNWDALLRNWLALLRAKASKYPVCEEDGDLSSPGSPIHLLRGYQALIRR
jgi:hypothetical protein